MNIIEIICFVIASQYGLFVLYFNAFIDGYSHRRYKKFIYNPIKLYKIEKNLFIYDYELNEIKFYDKKK